MKLGHKDNLYLLNTNRIVFNNLPSEITEWEINKLIKLLRIKIKIKNKIKSWGINTEIIQSEYGEVNELLNDLFLGLIIDQITGCWHIKDRKDKYRQITINNKKGVIAHRLAYKLFIGDLILPVVCHHCDWPGCCNPWHLFNGTYKDNIEDARLKGRLKRKINLTPGERFLLWRHVNSSNNHSSNYRTFKIND
jgi:hypothetical protein